MRILLSLGFLLSLLISGSLRAQVLQLPELHQFTTGTSVLIPDRGAVYGGGVMRSSESRRTVSYPFNPSGRTVTVNPRIGVNDKSGRIEWTSVKATIHGSPERTMPYGHELRESGNNDADSLRMIGTADLNQTAPQSLAAIRQQLSAEDAAANLKAIKYADMAEDCLKQGKTSIAKLFLQSAISTARGDYQAELKQRLTQIAAPATAKR